MVGKVVVKAGVAVAMEEEAMATIRPNHLEYIAVFAVGGLYLEAEIA